MPTRRPVDLFPPNPYGDSEPCRPTNTRGSRNAFGVFVKAKSIAWALWTISRVNHRTAKSTGHSSVGRSPGPARGETDGFSPPPPPPPTTLVRRNRHHPALRFRSLFLPTANSIASSCGGKGGDPTRVPGVTVDCGCHGGVGGGSDTRKSDGRATRGVPAHLQRVVRRKRGLGSQDGRHRGGGA
eukprot:scaffold461_cov321-Pavlova_lutheri.AAC.39